MDRSRALRATLLASLLSLMAFAAPGAIPNPPFSDADIGGPAMTGSATYDPATLVWTNNGGGGDIWNAADQFHFTYMSVTGDCVVTAQVLTQDPTNVWAKTGVMIRESTAAGSIFAMAAIASGNGHFMQWRGSTDGGAAYQGSTVAGSSPYWVRLTRSGSNFTMDASPDGSTWTLVYAQSVPMTAATLVGLATSAGDNAQLCNCSFDNFTIVDGTGVSIWPPPPPPGAPTLSLANPPSSTPVLNLSWTVPSSVAPITGYNILRGSSSGTETLYQTVSAATTTYNDTGVSFGSTYYYIVQAMAGSTVGADSNEQFASPTSIPPRTQKLGSRHMCGWSSVGVPGVESLAGAVVLLLLLSLGVRR
jgi:regulation of enolase protein 1 (concanavalin A-like superfamily)